MEFEKQSDMMEMKNEMMTDTLDDALGMYICILFYVPFLYVYGWVLIPNLKRKVENHNLFSCFLSW